MAVAPLGHRHQVTVDLCRRVSAAWGARTKTFLVTAPAGAGVSRVLADVATAIASGGVRTLTAAGGASRTPFASLAALLDTEAAEVGKVDDPRARLLSIADELCASGPLLLCLDDAHAADSASLASLLDLAAAATHLPIVLLLGLRPEPARTALVRLAARPAVRTVHLPDLDVLDLDVLVHERTGAWPGKHLRAMLASTAAAPLHAVTLLDDLGQSGALHRTGDQVELCTDADPLTDPAVLASRRIGRLSGVSRDIVRRLAVFGRPTGIEELAALGSGSAVDLLEPLQTLVDDGLLDFDAAGSVDFRHDLHRLATYEGIAEPVRQVLHRAVALRLQPPEQTTHLLATAPHSAAAAARVAEAAETLVLRAPEVAADLYRDAAALSLADATVTLLAAKRARALARAGQLRRAEQVATDALVVASEPATIGALRRTLIFAKTTRAATEEARGLVEETLRLPVPDQTRQILVDHLDQLALLAGSRRFSIAPTTPIDAMSLTGLVAEAMRQCLIGAVPVATELIAEATRRYGLQPPDEAGGSSADVWPGFIELHARGPVAARVVLRETVQNREQNGTAWQTAGHALFGAALTFMSGHLDDAAVEWDAAFEAAEAGEIGWISYPVGGRCLLDVMRGELGSARQRLEWWEDTRLPLQFGLPQPARARAALLEAEREHPAAAQVAAAAWAEGVRLGAGTWLRVVAPEFARIALRAADDGLRQRLYEDLSAVPFPTTLALEGQTVLALAMTGEEYDRVPAAAHAACAAAERVGDALTALAALEEASVAEAVLGDRDAARLHGGAAVALAQDAGAAGTEARIRSRLRTAGVRLGSSAGRQHASTGWDSLTPAEVRVAAMVAGGTSGSDIARQLYVSPRTVQSHVSHVLTKLGLASRVELAAAATRQIG